MSQNQFLSRSEIITPGDLKRRSIHKRNHQAAEHIQNEISEDENSESEGDSSPEIKRLYPDLSDALNEADYVPENTFRRSPGPNSTITKFKRQNPRVDPIVNQCNLETNFQSESNNSGFNYKILIGLLFFIIVCIVFSVSISYKAATIDVSQLLTDMKDEFEHQSPLTFRILKAALKPVANQSIEPSAPAIISLLADKGAFDTALAFSKYLAQSLAPEKYVLIDKNIYGHGDSNEIKWNLDKEIKSKLEPSSLNVIVVDKFENLPVDAAMIFHSYCDHETANFKRAVYLFVFSLNEIIPKNANVKYIDKTAINHLKNIWNVHADKIDSLITRITVTVVNIK